MTNIETRMSNEIRITNVESANPAANLKLRSGILAFDIRV